MSNISDIAARRAAPQKINEDDAIITARVVANYGDVGVTNPYFFDILSRFVIVMVEPTQRMPVIQMMHNMFFLVKRPKELWIDADGGVAGNIVNQRRMDSMGNANQGHPSSYSWDNIPRINEPYRIGEQIKIRKLKTPHYFYDQIFRSVFDSSVMSDATKNKYNESYLSPDPSGPASVSTDPAKYAFVKILPLFAHDGTRSARLYDGYYAGASMTRALQWAPSFNTKNNTGNPVSASIPAIDNQYQYGLGLNKYMFEMFWRQTVDTPASKIDPVIQWSFASKSNLLPNTHYVWSDVSSYRNTDLIFNYCGFEDINEGNKTREPSNDCMPLVVTNPATFPTPKTRQAGTILYNPSFTQVVTTP